MREASRYYPMLGLVVLLAGLVWRILFPSQLWLAVLPLTAAFWGLYAIFHWQELKGLAHSRTARYGAGSSLAVVLVLGILVLVGIMTDRHSIRWDLTIGHRHTLAPQSLKILENLDQDVSVTAFFQRASADRVEAEDLLDRYARTTRRFRYDIIDPDIKPSVAKAAGITQYGAVVVAGRDEKETVMHLDEEKLTNAILRVTHPGRKKLYFLTGHGERSLIDDQKDGYKRAGELLGRQNYALEPLLLMRAQKVPEDAAAVILAGPLKDPEPAEIDALTAYLAGGGRMLMLIDPEPLDRLTDWLKGYGVDLKKDMVVDKMSRLFGGDYLTPIVVDYAPHPITKDLMGLASFFPMARSVNVSDTLPAGVRTEVLLRTSENSWAENNLEALYNGSATLDPEDLRGPVPLGVVGSCQRAVSKDTEAASDPKKRPTGKFVVVGDSDFASNTNLDLQVNSDLFLSCIAWLAESEDLISIRAKSDKSQPLVLSLGQARVLFWLPVVVMPLVVLIIGFVVIRRRRKTG